MGSYSDVTYMASEIINWEYEQRLLGRLDQHHLEETNGQVLHFPDPTCALSTYDTAVISLCMQSA